jgi:hypothetical protein
LALHIRRARRWTISTIHARRHNARLDADALTLNFFPGRPQPRALMFGIVRRLGLRFGYTPGGAGLTMAWDAGAWFDEDAARRLPADAINGRCLDVSKSTVDRLWAEIAGYGVTVDPLLTDGPIVIKSELNGTHDGQLVMGPLAARQSGYVYQRLIDGRRDGQVYATRATIMGERIALAFEKWRPQPNWFHGGSVVAPVAPAQLWSADEMALILRFCAAIGLDCGDVDVLRETCSGRIYVVDANRTPIRPIGLPLEHDDLVYSTLADAFAGFLAERQRGRSAR